MSLQYLHVMLGMAAGTLVGALAALAVAAVVL